MALDLRTLVAPEHTALVLQEVQNGVVGSPSALPALADAAAAVDLDRQLRAARARGACGRRDGGALHRRDARRRPGRQLTTPACSRA